MKRPLHVLISSGPTREAIDPVRFISNYSTGYLGTCLATEALRRGHRVTLVSGPTTFQPPERVRVIWVEQARQMQEALAARFPKADVLIMAAAVCDFQPVRPKDKKLPRAGRLTLALKATPDIVGGLPRRNGQLVVGFALDTDHFLKQARAKLRQKRLDLVVANQAQGPGGPFGRGRVRAFLLDRSGAVRNLGIIPKDRLASIVLDNVESLWYGQKAR